MKVWRKAMAHKRREEDPCYGCERRYSESKYNCHSECPDYLAIKEKKRARAELIRKKKAEEGLVTDLRIRSLARLSRDKRKQNAWKG